jgi:hypothetical protein
MPYNKISIHILAIHNLKYAEHTQIKVQSIKKKCSDSRMKPKLVNFPQVLVDELKGIWFETTLPFHCFNKCQPFVNYQRIHGALCS